MVVLLNPRLVVASHDPLTTGVLYMPLGLAHLAAALKEAGLPVAVVDALGQRPRQARRRGGYLLFGLEDQQAADLVPPGARLLMVYAQSLLSHEATAGLVRALAAAHPRARLAVVENSQAVTAYALQELAPRFFDLGAHYVLRGDPEHSGVLLARAVLGGDEERQARQVPGLAGQGFANEPSPASGQMERLPPPAWEMFPLANYWDLGFAHGPLSARRYLPLLTSRGCPYACRFCVTPATNPQGWRPRPAQEVVDEMEALAQRFGVREFHWEDLNPTVSDRRMQDICREIIGRGLRVTWKLVSGTKAETIRGEETVSLMARAGCRYVSISPETGSPRVLGLMNKPFDLEHARWLIGCLHGHGIYTQACFVLGFPGETTEDRQMTRDLVRELTRRGIDEIALFIISPVPGSHIYQEMEGFQSLSDLNFSPTWRRDYQELSRFRQRLYLSFLGWKLLHHPGRLLRQPLDFLRRRFNTKMEMVPYRGLVYKTLGLGAPLEARPPAPLEAAGRGR